VRLADATPRLFLDVAVPGLMLFLLSRLWVMVAPELGLRLGRRVLGIGLPLLLVASVVGHVAAPTRALQLSEGVDFTAFFVCLPLGIVWLGCLLLRLVRRLLGRTQAAQVRGLTRAAEWFRVCAVTLPVLGLVALFQWDLGRDEVKALSRRAEDLRKLVRALEATEAKAEEFAREREQLAERVKTLHLIVPRSPGLEELVSRIGRQASEYGIEIVDWSGAAGEDQGVLQGHPLTLVLSGDFGRLKELVERGEKLARLFVWERVRVGDSRATAHLVAYSAPDRPAAPSRDVCAHPISQVWLWPYTEKVRLARAEVDWLCADRSRHAETRAQVEDFNSTRARARELIEAIEKIREGRRLSEIVVEAEPPPEEVPVPSKKT
jgi:Tfp pilus assembly protein PilO